MHPEMTQKCEPIKKDIQLVDEMLEAAKEYGLETEVVLSFGSALLNRNCTIRQATVYALDEWDIL